jgi:hypothetical protein
MAPEIIIKGDKNGNDILKKKIPKLTLKQAN